MRSRARMVIAAAACAAATLSTASTASGHPVHDGSGKEAGFDRVAEPVSPGGVPQERLSSIKCTDDKAGIFPCHRVDLASFVPLSELGGSIWANDVWGWTDPQTGRDYALAKLFEGTAFVDVTDETDPVKAEHAVGALFPKKDWTMLSHHLIWHGRRVCHARKPACGACTVAKWCPSYGEGPTDPVEAAKLVRTEGRA